MENWRLDLVAVVVVVERVLGFFQGFLALFGLFFQTLACDVLWLSSRASLSS